MTAAARMDALDAMDDAQFRQTVREWVEAACPGHLRFPAKRRHFDEVRDWDLILAKQGWLAPGWPREQGGMGLSPGRQLILIDEFERYGVPRLPDHGIIMLGPLLIRYGTDEQRARFLPKILSGDEIWCQGYSEPGAGSDLASLRTEAVREGDEWIINGQKTWTTLATDAHWMFLLARTDKAAKKQNGISFLLVPMDAPGVTIRPIINLEMHDEYCEVFFDNVRVPADHLVGEVNQGWAMAKALLGFERIFFGSPKQSAFALERLSVLASHYGVAEDPVFRDKFVRLHMDLADHADLFERFADQLRRGETLGADVSVLKLHQTDLYQRITDLMIEIAATDSGLSDPVDGDRAINAAGYFIQSRPTTIYGGTSEIQRGILAREVLRLPA